MDKFMGPWRKALGCSFCTMCTFAWVDNGI